MLLLILETEGGERERNNDVRNTIDRLPYSPLPGIELTA